MSYVKYLLLVPFLLSFLTWTMWILNDYGTRVDVGRVIRQEVHGLRNTTSHSQGERLPFVGFTPEPHIVDTPNETLHLFDTDAIQDAETDHQTSEPSKGFPCKTVFNSPSYYVIEWIHWEQMTMAVTSLIYLAWFTSGWNARVVEPFTRNSFFYGLDSSAHNRHPMSAIFNMDLFNDMLCRHHIAPIVTFDEFLSKGAKNFILLHLFYGESDGKSFSELKSNKSDILELFIKHNSSVVSCGNIKYMKEVSKGFLKAIKFSTRSKWREFNVIHCCCVDAFRGTSREMVWKKCGIADFKKKLSIVVTNWRGVNDKVNFRLYTPEFSMAYVPKPWKNAYPYNSRVRENASSFLKSVSEGQPLLLVHIRSEKLGMREKSYPNYFNNCINKIMELTSEIASRNKTHKFTTACITDVSQHGSRSCKKNCLGKELMALAIKKHKLNHVWYDPHKFNGLADSTFVAAVEQEMMSMADELILVGGGSFQAQLKLRFSLNNHSPSQVHQICT